MRHLAPTAGEAGDLALCTGRLAYADPAWTLSSGRPGPLLLDRLFRGYDLSRVCEYVRTRWKVCKNLQVAGL
jgi:hypothetical protein